MEETIPNIAGLLPAPSDMAGGDNHFNDGLLHDGKMANRLNDNDQNTVLSDYQSGADGVEMVKPVVRKFGNYAPKAPRMPDGTIQLGMPRWELPHCHQHCQHAYRTCQARLLQTVAL